jgi:hypothetical protein
VNNKNILTVALAMIVTSIAISMAAVAAADRGGTVADKILLVILASTLAVLVHLLPSLSKNRLVWLIWTGCFLATVYGHLTFFTNAQVRAGEVRAVDSLQNRDLVTQITLVTQERDSIAARPVTALLQLLSRVTDWKERGRIKIELAESKRRIALTDQLIKLNEKMDNTHVSQSNDKVTSLLSAATGSNGGQISLLIGIFFAILIDLSGVLLWREIFWSNASNADIHAPIMPVTKPTAPLPTAVIKTVSEADVTLENLKQAINAGVCKPTVTSIRMYAGVGQTRASELRKRLLES